MRWAGPSAGVGSLERVSGIFATKSAAPAAAMIAKTSNAARKPRCCTMNPEMSGPTTSPDRDPVP